MLLCPMRGTEACQGKLDQLSAPAGGMQRGLRTGKGAVLMCSAERPPT